MRSPRCSQRKLLSAATAGDLGLVRKWGRQGGALTDSACANIMASAEAEIAAKVLVMSASQQLADAASHAEGPTTEAALARGPSKFAFQAVAAVETAAQRVQLLAHDSAVGAARSAAAKWAEEAMLNCAGKAHRATRDIEPAAAPVKTPAGASWSPVDRMRADRQQWKALWRASDVPVERPVDPKQDVNWCRAAA